MAADGFPFVDFRKREIVVDGVYIDSNANVGYLGISRVVSVDENVLRMRSLADDVEYIYDAKTAWKARNLHPMTPKQIAAFKEIAGKL